MQTHLSVDSISLVLTCSSFPGTKRNSTKGNFCPAFRQLRGRQRTLPAPADSQLPSVQNNAYAKAAGFDVAYPDHLHV